MKNLFARRSIFCALIFGALAAVSATAQVHTGGEAIDVVDGRTVVVRIPAGAVNLELQHIEVPEPGQQLHAVVKDHLKNLVVGKVVAFHAKSLSPGKGATGQLVLNGVDISQQMLRDGAAWLVPQDITGQENDEHALYAKAEELARTEKRGVWSVAGLKPAWQFRIEKAKADADAVEAARAAQRKEILEAPDAKTVKVKKGAWSDANPWLKNPGGLTHGYNAATKTGFLGTSLLGVTEADNQPAGQRTAVDMTYLYTEMGEKGRQGVFAITVLSAANDARFLKSNTLMMMVDGKKFIVGKPRRDEHKDQFGAMERLTYYVDKATIEKIAHGGEVVVMIGEYSIKPSAGLQMLLYNMLQLAS